VKASDGLQTGVYLIIGKGYAASMHDGLGSWDVFFYVLEFLINPAPKDSLHTRKYGYDVELIFCFR